MNNNPILQLWLAKQLPERIKICKSVATTPNAIELRWIDSDNSQGCIYTSEIKDTEWPYIVGLVEEKLTVKDLAPVARLLIEKLGEYGAIFANWKEHTTALKKVMGEEYERA